MHRRGTVDHGERHAARAVTLLLLLLFGLILIRLFWVHAQTRRSGHAARMERLDGPRGTILARDGSVLAQSLPTFDLEIDCWANEDMPAALADDVIDVISREVELDRDQERAIRDRFRLDKKRAVDRIARGTVPSNEFGADGSVLRYQWSRRLARGLCSRDVLTELARLDRRHFDGCRFRLRLLPSWKRVYPAGAPACHVVGMIGDDGTGKIVASGLERLPILSETSSESYRLRREGGMTVLEGLRTPALAGELDTSVIETTLDLDCQERAFELLQAAWKQTDSEWGTLFLIDLRDGEILALAGAPGFDPARRKESDSFFPVTHHALFVPGSVIKPLLIAEALERHAVGFDETIRCEGDDGSTRFKVARRRRPIVDDHHVGIVSLSRLVIESSNIGAVRVGMRGGESLHEAMLTDFRLADAPLLGLPLPRVENSRGQWVRVRGRVPGPDRLRNRRNYVSYTGPSLSFGYELLVYPLVFARAFCSVVTGARYELRLIRAYAEPGGPRIETPRAGPGLRMFDPQVVAWMRRTLAQVVTDPKGTARRILSDETRDVVGGKTGTAFQDNPKTGERTYWASFVGFAPVDRPRYLAMGVLENKKIRRFYGGEFVAPAVSDLLLYTLAKDRANRAGEDRIDARDRSGARARHGGASRASLGLASDSSPAGLGSKGGDR